MNTPTVPPRRIHAGAGLAGAVTAAVPHCGMPAVLIAAVLLAAPGALPAADPVRLFDGHSSGRGTLRVLLRRPRAFTVESEGRLQPDGSFRLDQVVSFDGAPAARRHWILRRVAPGRFTFDLSDASGAGAARVQGSRLRLDYPLGHGLRMRQWLQPLPDGRIANTGSIRWLGLPVGRLRETIVRRPTGAASH